VTRRKMPASSCRFPCKRLAWQVAEVTVSLTCGRVVKRGPALKKSWRRLYAWCDATRVREEGSACSRSSPAFKRCSKTLHDINYSVKKGDAYGERRERLPKPTAKTFVQDRTCWRSGDDIRPLTSHGFSRNWDRSSFQCEELKRCATSLTSMDERPYPLLPPYKGIYFA